MLNREDWITQRISGRIRELESVKAEIESRVAILRRAAEIMAATNGVVGQELPEGNDVEEAELVDGLAGTTRAFKRLATRALPGKPPRRWNAAPEPPAGYSDTLRTEEYKGLMPSVALVRAAKAAKGILYPKAVGEMLVNAGIYPGVTPEKAASRAYSIAYHNKKMFRSAGNGTFRLLVS